MIKIGSLDISLEHRQVLLDGQPVRLGSRAFDILVLLIAADGKLVSRDEIMRHVWPNTVVEENNLQVHIHAIRRAFGAERERIRTEPGRGYRLILVANRQNHPIQGGREGAVNPDALPVAHQRLPAGVPSLIGRDDALTEIARLLCDSQCLTLIGVGGIGKTRLAIEVAHRVQGDFSDGVVFVPFASIDDSQSAFDAFARATGTRLSPGSEALAQVGREWSGREALIVLDNCEQVLDVAAAITEVLINAGSGMRVLATSLEAMRVRDEITYTVPPLALPTDDEITVVWHSEAVQFFVACARALGANFPSDEHSIRLVGEVCRRLDGIPLALELAAMRASVLGIGGLAANLDDRFGVLTGGRRSAPPRHQTLKATLDWSYRLLDDVERKVLRWLGMFVSSFTLETACLLVEGAGVSRTQAFEAISGLVSRSLLSVDPEGPRHRYRMLETTRAYALQQLDDSGERATAASTHAVLVED
ncbi:hypothetical protein PPGU19_088520 (plasmid) [Paraburkholderia sp. PGU19]|nr:hypothetical protein PPGU19_088520 [Paraburkholderia sp. PGU19]